MKEVKLLLLLPALVLILSITGCNEDNNNNALAQPGPMSGTDVTGTVNAPTSETCPKEVLIEGMEAGDVVVVEIESTGDMTADAKITNSTKGTSTSCSGASDMTLPPAEAKGCNITSSTIPGLKVNDEMTMVVAFSFQGKQVTLEAPGSDSLTCAFITIQTINAM